MLDAHEAPEVEAVEPLDAVETELLLESLLLADAVDSFELLVLFEELDSLEVLVLVDELELEEAEPPGMVSWSPG